MGNGRSDTLRSVTVLDGSGNGMRGAVTAGQAVGGRNLPAHADNATYFDYPDWPGTERMQATTAGYAQDICTSLPYGADLNCTGGTDYWPMHFTGQVRDAATSLDHFPARYYTSAWGRFMTPDWSAAPTPVPYASFSDPQSLDLYAYTLDNPETNTDPNGHWCLFGAIGTTCSHPKKQWAKGNPPTVLHPEAAGCGDPHCVTATAVIPAGAMAGDSASTWWEIGGSDLGDLVLGTATAGVGVIVALTLGQTGGDPALLYREQHDEKAGAQHKELTPGEIRKMKAADPDPEKIKKDLGLGSGANLYKDPRGNIYAKPKGSSGRGEPTGLNINHLPRGQQ